MAHASTNITNIRPTLNLGSPLRFVQKVSAVAKQRRALANLTSAQLADIGVSFKQAQKEASRPAIFAV